MVVYPTQQCQTQTCPQKCCNSYGNCVNTSSPSSYQNTCWYYYTSYTDACAGGAEHCRVGNNMSALIGGIVGGVFGLVVLVIAVIVLCKKYRGNQVQMQTQGGPNNRQITISPAGKTPDNSASYTKNPQTPQSYPQVYPQSYPPVYPQIYQQQNYPTTYAQLQPYNNTPMAHTMTNQLQVNSPAYLTN